MPHYTTYESLKRTFESETLSDYPEFTKILINGTDIVLIPTKEIFVSGDWVARHMAGLSFLLIESFLRKNKIKWQKYRIAD